MRIACKFTRRGIYAVFYTYIKINKCITGRKVCLPCCSVNIVSLVSITAIN